MASFPAFLLSKWPDPFLAQSAREVGEIQMSGWKNRMDAGARGMEADTSAIAGLGQRIDPHIRQQVGLDASGVRFLTNPRGEYLVVQAADVVPPLPLLLGELAGDGVGDRAPERHKVAPSRDAEGWIAVVGPDPAAGRRGPTLRSCAAPTLRY